MFKFLTWKTWGFGGYWDISEYYDRHVEECIAKVGHSARILLALDERNAREQRLHNAIVRKCVIDYSRGGADNEGVIEVAFDLGRSTVSASYGDVRAFCFGQRGEFSPVLEVDVHEMVFSEEGLIEHRILCHGASKPFFIVCSSLSAIESNATQGTPPA